MKSPVFKRLYDVRREIYQDREAYDKLQERAAKVYARLESRIKERDRLAAEWRGIRAREREGQ